MSRGRHAKRCQCGEPGCKACTARRNYRRSEGLNERLEDLGTEAKFANSFEKWSLIRRAGWMSRV